MKDTFDNFCIDIFNKYPYLKSFNWTQYTLYYSLENDFKQIITVDIGNNQIKEATEEILNFLNSFDESYFIQKFGDHVSVTITRTGVLIEEFEKF